MRRLLRLVVLLCALVYYTSAPGMAIVNVDAGNNGAGGAGVGGSVGGNSGGNPGISGESTDYSDTTTDTPVNQHVEQHDAYTSPWGTVYTRDIAEDYTVDISQARQHALDSIGGLQNGVSNLARSWPFSLLGDVTNMLSSAPVGGIPPAWDIPLGGTNTAPNMHVTIPEGMSQLISWGRSIILWLMYASGVWWLFHALTGFGS